ncbi:DNA primase [Candidatus Peregrinibacteria bacterium]|nr:DNA primase [Candidatus Peregrinibacteria bacterium]
MDHLEEIRARIGIEELVGSYVQLKKAGRNLKGLCPFHNEKSPSFIVSPDKGIAYCFGCHQGGDIFKFTQLVENVNFPEALKILAQKTGVKLPEHAPLVANQRLKTIEINQWATQFYQEKLEANPPMKNYFLDRGLTDETIRKFKLGYAPDSFDQLKNFLAGKNFDKKDLIEAAVVSQRSIADQNTYDRFRNRLMFPIFDHQDNPVGFSGRIVGQGEPKYINSPETPAYSKSLILYGLNWAKESVKAKDMAIFMEGYMDVIAAHQAGTTNAMATCGTALTPQQLKLIQRYTKNVCFCFDGDSAGKDATFRAIELAQLSEVNIQVIMVPEGKDPDECIKKNPAAWQKAVENPISVMDFYFDFALSHFDSKSIQGKRQIMDFLMPVIKTAKSEVEQNIHLNRLALELKTDTKLLWNDLRAMKGKKIAVQETSATGPKGREQFSQEEYLLGFVFSHPEIYPEVAKGLIENIPLDPNTERFYKACKTVYTRESFIDLAHIKEELSEEDRGRVEVLGLLVDEEYPDFSEETRNREIRKLIRAINLRNLTGIHKEYQYKIRLSQDPEQTKVLLNRLKETSELMQGI